MVENQILDFKNDVDKDDLRLMDTFTSKNQDGKEEKYNINTRIYLYIPYINEIAKHKPLEEFNEFEKMMYIFQNGLNDDLMRLENQSRVIQIMNKKLEEFNSDEKLLDLAFRIKLDKITQKGIEQEIYDEGMAEKQKQNVLKMFEFKYPLKDSSFLENLTYEQYEDIFMMLLQDKDIDAIKGYILK